jgi:hypothetical protein
MFHLIIFMLAYGGHPNMWYSPSAAVVGTYRTEEACDGAAKGFRPNLNALGLGPGNDQVREIRVLTYCSRTDVP